MFGLAACDDGGPGFVNAKRANDNQCASSWGAVAKQMQQHASTCRVDAEDVIGKREQTGTWVREAARAIDEQ